MNRKLKLIYLLVSFTILCMGVILSSGSFTFRQVKDLEVTEGTGKVIKAGDRVLVHYEMFVMNNDARGAKVHSTYLQTKPVELVVGSGQIPPGFDRSLVGMRAGGKKEILVPSALAYGRGGAAGGLIPASTDLIYKLEVKRVL